MKIVLVLTLTSLLCINVSFSQHNDLLKVNQVNSRYPTLDISTYQDLLNGGHPVLWMQNFGGTPTSILPTKASQILGTVVYAGHNGSQTVQVGRLSVYSTGDFSIGSYPAKMHFQIGGTGTCCGLTRMVIDGTNGNVGIGTTDPTTKLHVNGGGAGSVDFLVNGRMRSGDSDNSGGIWMGGGNDLFVGQKQADKVGFWTGGSWRLIANTSGDIGVGTLNPSAKLHVNGGGAGSVDFLVNGRMRSGDANNSGGIWMGEGNDLFVGQEQNDKIGFWTGGMWRFVVKTNGNVGIGTSSPQSKLSVQGQIRATEVKVLADISVPDYVFEPDYELRTLKETKEYITKNKHLPEIPSATEISENGIDLGDMNMRLLKKIEELTLYQIELLERIEELEKKVNKD